MENIYPISRKKKNKKPQPTNQKTPTNWKQQNPSYVNDYFQDIKISYFYHTVSKS